MKQCLFNGHLNNIIERAFINHVEENLFGCTKTGYFAKASDFLIVLPFQLCLGQKFNNQVLVFSY